MIFEKSGGSSESTDGGRYDGGPRGPSWPRAITQGPEGVRRAKSENLSPEVVAGAAFKDGIEVIDIPVDRAA